MKRKAFFVFYIVVLVAALGATGYWYLHPELQSRFFPPAQSTREAEAPTIREPDLTGEKAIALLNSVLAKRPVVVRLAVGDVIAIDLQGRTIPLYVKLADAGYLRLRLCHFPGEGAIANQICLAELDKKSDAFVYKGTTPLKVLPAPDSGSFAPANRSFVELVIADSRAAETTLNQEGRSAMSLSYRVGYELTPLAALFGISADALPKIEGKAEFRRTADGWTLERDGLS